MLELMAREPLNYIAIHTYIYVGTCCVQTSIKPSWMAELVVQKVILRNHYLDGEKYHWQIVQSNVKLEFRFPGQK